MVVGQAPIMLASALSPPLHLSSRMCSLPATAQTYQAFPGLPPVNSTNMPCVSPPLTIQCNQPSSPLTSPSSAGSPQMLPSVTCNVVPTNGSTVFTYIPVTHGNTAPQVPTNLYAGVPVMPYSSAVTISCKIPDQPVPSSISNIVPCTQPMPPSAIVPCQPRLINSTVLQCTPCQYSLPGENFVCSSLAIPNNNPLIPPSMSIAQNICSTNVVSPWKQSYGMEQVWRKEFETLFYTYTRHSQHIWTLLPVTERPGGVWYENVDSAKVRFCCDACGHGWTSMKGRVAFWFILNYATNEGVVCLKLYGQQCDRCKRGDYEPAMWYPEEVLKVMVNIYNKVGQVYYGFEQAPYHKTRRPGKPRTPHNSDLCQACKDGVCAERR